MSEPTPPAGDAKVPATDGPPPSWRVRLHGAIEAPTLGQWLVHQNRITAQQLAQAIAIQRLSGERLGHVLVRLEYLSTAELDHILNRQRLLRWFHQVFG